MSAITNAVDLFPVFLGGAGRSGTTLAVDMIGLHPELSPIYETSFVVELITLMLEREPPASDEKTICRRRRE